MSRSILAVFSLVFLVLATLCVISSPANASKQEAGVFVETLAKDVIAMIGNESLSKDDKRDKLESIFEKHVDIDWIAQFVLGKHWRAATDEQKKKYLVNYHKFLLLNYTSNFENFADTRFEIEKSEAGNKAGEYIIGMLLKRPNQQDLKVDYRLREDANSNYKVIDIVAEGISLITSQRSEFNSVVTRNGLDYLIDQLASKTIKTGSN